MVLYGAIPESKRFFKISELAGKRWPSVTAEEIYDWHDAGFEVPVAADGFPPIVDTTVSNSWNDPPHCGKINLMSYWAFFTEFHTFPLTPPETILESFKENIFIDSNLIDRFEELMNDSPNLFNVELLSNSFFMVASDCSNGFSFNNRGFIDCWEFYNEQGILCPSRRFDENEKRWVTSEMRINKECLLIKASSVQFIEHISPEITSADRRSKDIGIFQAEQSKDGSRTRNSSSKRAENTDLRIIGALKTIIMENTGMKSQADIIESITNDDRFKRIPGLSERVIQDRFSQANTSIKDAGD